jgi:hypothetical protein
MRSTDLDHLLFEREVLANSGAVQRTSSPVCCERIGVRSAFRGIVNARNTTLGWNNGGKGCSNQSDFSRGIGIFERRIVKLQMLWGPPAMKLGGQ